MLAGIVCAYWFYMRQPAIPAMLQKRFHFLYVLLDNKYFMDKFNERFIAAGARGLGTGLWKTGDRGLIDGLVNGSAGFIAWSASIVRRIQTGYIYHYAFVMILGVLGFLIYFLPNPLFK
jgi:NADH-quinone oxidoreductase subunit L